MPSFNIFMPSFTQKWQGTLVAGRRHVPRISCNRGAISHAQKPNEGEAMLANAIDKLQSQPGPGHLSPGQNIHPGFDAQNKNFAFALKHFV